MLLRSDYTTMGILLDWGHLAVPSWSARTCAWRLRCGICSGIVREAGAVPAGSPITGCYSGRLLHLSEVLPQRDDLYAENTLSIERAKVSPVSGDEVCRAGERGGLDDRLILERQ